MGENPFFRAGKSACARTRKTEWKKLGRVEGSGGNGDRFSSESSEQCPFIDQVMLPNRATVTRRWAEALKWPVRFSGNTAIGAIARQVVAGVYIPRLEFDQSQRMPEPKLSTFQIAFATY